MPQIVLPIATDTVGQMLYEKMIEGKGLKNTEALPWMEKEKVRASEEPAHGAASMGIEEYKGDK